MHTRMRQTSLVSYRMNKGNTCEQRAYEIIATHGPLTDSDIAKLLRWEINRVTGRRNSLVRQGIVKKAGTIIKPDTNRPACLWGLDN